MSDYITVMTTTGSKADALAVARALVEGQNAACVQVIGPITSVYMWQDAVQEDEEFLCLAKTRADRFPAVEETIRAVHPYEVPEIIAIPVTAGGQDYLAWVDEVLG